MRYSVEDLEKGERFSKIEEIPYSELVPFIFRHLKNVTFVTILFWTLCLASMAVSVLIRIRTESGLSAFLHSVLGFVILPVLIIPIHELLHIIPYYLTGARNIRTGMDLKQFFFYVTAHRYVAGPAQFIMVALVPFLSISIVLIFLIISLPGAWKWSLSAFLFVHTTMCAGDIALLNFYFKNRDKKIYTWDDADEKVAYFYEERGGEEEKR
jgi:hypothetical protein